MKLDFSSELVKSEKLINIAFQKDQLYIHMTDTTNRHQQFTIGCFANGHGGGGVMSNSPAVTRMLAVRVH